MNVSPDLHLAFDVGHSSIGWAVVKSQKEIAPSLLGCGVVIFSADDCLASQRRGFRRQRRQIRATRLRIARLKTALGRLGVMSGAELDRVSSCSPWLLAARVLREGRLLTWPELWDVLRWYAHNRGYDGNRGWSHHDVGEKEDSEREKRANELLGAFRDRHGRDGTMAEVFCDVLGLDPLGASASSRIRVRNLGAAFKRGGVEREVERILRAHAGVLPELNDRLIEGLMRDHTVLACPELRLPARFGQRLAAGALSRGGILFGQLVPRFHNRIIARCPITFERVYRRTKEETGNDARAKREADKRAKVPGVNCAEFYRYRWAMQLANIKVAAPDGTTPRSLTAAERQAVHAEMEKWGYLTPKQLKGIVRVQTGGLADNLEQLLARPDAERALVLDPVRRFIHAHGLVSALWPALPEQLRKRFVGQWRRGHAITVASLIETSGEERAAIEAACDKYLETQMTKKRARDEPLTRESFLRTPLQVRLSDGRAPHTREVMREALEFVLATDHHPTEEGGPLHRGEAIRHAHLQRALDEQTNNHLLRHRLKLLERLHGDLIKEYAGGSLARVAEITIEVNRDLREMSGKTAQEQAKALGQQLADFKSVAKKLEGEFVAARLHVHVGPGLIRKGRIAEDLGRICPFSGKPYDSLDLLHGRVDKDYIIPRSERPSDSLDSLVITFPEIVKWKGKRTAYRFVEEEQGREVPGLPNVFVKTLAAYVRDIEALKPRRDPRKDRYYKEKRISIDDLLRCWNRKRLLLLRDFVVKEFAPGDLTQTSQLVRLGAQAIQKHHAGAGKPPLITSLPGSVTVAVRKSWNLIGCLATANPQAQNPGAPGEEGGARVRTRTEIRGLTHLYHALDACVLAFASLFLPRYASAWGLLVKRRLSAGEETLAREFFGSQIGITKEGELRLQDLAPQFKEQIRERLMERRVVQHIPAEMAGLPTRETVWRVFDPADSHRSTRRLASWLAARKVKIPRAEDSKVIIIRRKRQDAVGDPDTGGKVLREEGHVWRWVYDEVEKSKVLGLNGTASGKLVAIKGGKLIADNYGMALLPDAPKGQQFRVIRFFRVWSEIEKLRAMNGGKKPAILRRGQIVTFSQGKWMGRIWRILGIEENGRVRFFEADKARRIDAPENYQKAQITSLLRDGLRILKAPLCGVPPLGAAAPLEDGRSARLPEGAKVG